MRVVRVLPDVGRCSAPLRLRGARRTSGATCASAPGSGSRCTAGGSAAGSSRTTSSRRARVGRLKALAKLSGLGPPPAVVALAEWAAWRWAGPLAPFSPPPRPGAGARAAGRAPPPRRRAPGPAADPLADRGAGRCCEHRATDGRPCSGSRPATDLLGAVVDAVRGGAAAPVLVLVPNARVGRAARRAARPARARGGRHLGGGGGRLAGRGRRPGRRVRASWPPRRGGRPRRPRRGLPRGALAPASTPPVVVAERRRRDGAPCLLASPRPTAIQVPRRRRMAELPASAERGGWPTLQRGRPAGGRPAHRALLRGAGARWRAGVLPAGRLVVVLNRDRPGPAARLRRPAASWPAASACGRRGRAGRAAASPARRCGADAARRLRGLRRAPRLKVLRAGVSSGPRGAGRAARDGGGGGRRAPRPGRCPTPPVLVGTEAVLHRVRRAAAVAFFDFDQHLLAPRLGAGEQALALLARAGRLVGGRSSAGAGRARPDPAARPRGAGAAVHGPGDLASRLPRATSWRCRAASWPLPPFRRARRSCRGPAAAELAAGARRPRHRARTPGGRGPVARSARARPPDGSATRLARRGRGPRAAGDGRSVDPRHGGVRQAHRYHGAGDDHLRDPPVRRPGPAPAPTGDRRDRRGAWPSWSTT